MKTLAIIVVVVIIIGAIMFITNPTIDDFSVYLENKATRNIEKYADGTKNLAENMVNADKPLAGNYSKSKYERKNYYVFSIFESDSSVLTYGNKYLGLFKVFFKLE